jgi:predicted AAA+ superfamily ATPase
MRNSTRTVYEQLWRGGLPEADTLPLELLPDFFNGYFRTYIERDARLLMDVGDWQQFGRFVQLAAALTSQEVNNSKLGREIGVTPQTARRWLAVLKATFQWFEVAPYSGNTLKRIAGKAKGYLSDTGLACYLQRISSPGALAGHPMAGALFESAVMAEIRKLIALESVAPMLHHWRSHGGAEVDILLERDGIFYPIEVKLSTTPTKNDTRGITAFRTTYPNLTVAPGLVITPGNSASDGQLLWKISDHDYALSWQAV